MMTAPPIPSILRVLADRCHAQGATAYLVGGSVRDHVLNLPIKDHDVEVFGMPSDRLERTLRKLGHVNTVGRAFGVFKLRVGQFELDVSLPRRDSKTGPGHRGIHVEGDPTMSIEEAVTRRDLTINAMMWDIVAERLLDPAGGLSDLRDRTLRAVDATTFLEDPLRAVRVVQFAARFEFTPDNTLLKLCSDAALHELPAERIREEWLKLMLKGSKPSMGLHVARRAGMLPRLFPDLVDNAACDGALDHLAAEHRERLSSPGARLSAMLLTWLWTQSHVTGALDALELHRWLGHPVRRKVLEAHSQRARRPSNDAELRHLSTRCELELLFTAQAVQGDAQATTHLARARALHIAHEAPAALLQGRHLKSIGVPPGPAMGRVLAAVYTQQLDGSVCTLDEATRAATHWMDTHQS